MLGIYTFTVLMLVATEGIGASLYFERLSTECSLTDTAPDPLADIKNFASLDNTSLANFDGYLIYHPRGTATKDRYMPLKMKGLNMTYHTDPYRELHFEHDCGQFWVIFTDVQSTYRASLYQVILGLPYFGHTSCSLDLGFDTFTMGQNERYQCNKQMRYLCSPRFALGKRPFMTLVVNKLELEVDGDPKQISRGQFSKPAATCK